MKLPLRLKRNDVNNFLRQVKEKLKTEGTDGFMFIRTRKAEKPNPEFTNSYCLGQLEYDTEDVMSEILTLEVSHYYESLRDKKVLILAWNYCMYSSKKFRKNRYISKSK